MKKRNHSRQHVAGGWLLWWTLFIGLGAVAGASGMLLDPSGRAMGMDALLPFFQVLPFSEELFQDFTFSGIALLIVNGVTNLTAAVLLLNRRRQGVILGGVFGITLMLWICIQFVIFPFNFMSTSYFLFGFCQASAGYMAWVFSLASPVREFCRQSAGKLREADYILVHHTSGRYEGVVREMDQLLGISHGAVTNVRCRMGEFELADNPTQPQTSAT